MVAVTRRVVLQSSGVAAAGTLVQAGAASGAQAADPLGRARFAKAVGSAFTLTAGSQTFACTLSSVDDLQGAPPGSDRRYRLTFTTKAAGPAHGTYTFSRPGFGSVTLYVVPDAAARTYVAVVNRL